MRLPYEELLEEKKRMEFYMTEGEILNNLIKEATNLSQESKELSEKLEKRAKETLEILPSEFLIKNNENSERVEIGVGVDGSFQVVGGSGGIWYVPLSAVRIIFEEGLAGKVRYKYFSTIRKIEAVDESEAKKFSSYLMLYLESSEISSIIDMDGISNAPIFLDGPIIDPPQISNDPRMPILPSEYLKYRVNALKKALNDNNLVMGCVKRIRDKDLLSQVSRKDLALQDISHKFYNDLYFVAAIFKLYRFQVREHYNGTLATQWFEKEYVNDMEKYYRNNGIRIYYFFYQRDSISPITRIEIATLRDLSNDEQGEIIKILNYWTLKGHGLPLPALLSHEKCTIREGCAQILYEEIITKESVYYPFTKIWIR